ncbi:MAG: hypothetical protein ACD_58C00296G0007 [uncultured bacterium]|nr:MAG: hypothetical protein ACD_58C00296G0007 [uncultured bacterium]
MTKNGRNYFKIALPIILILVIIALVVISKKPNDALLTNLNDNIEVMVRDASVQDTPSTINTNSASQDLGPATMEDLGGTNGSANLDQLLDGKEINIGE